MDALFNFINDIWNGTNTTFMAVFLVGLFTNTVAWYLTKERRSRAQIFYRQSSDNEIIVSIQNPASHIIEIDNFVQPGPVLDFTTAKIKDLDRVECREGDISFDEKSVTLNYLNRKSTITFRILFNDKIEKPRKTHRQKGYRGEIIPREEKTMNSFGLSTIIDKLLERIFYWIFAVLFPMIIPSYCAMSLQASGNLSLASISLVIFSIFAWVFIFSRIKRGPRNLSQMLKFYESDLVYRIKKELNSWWKRKNRLA